MRRELRKFLYGLGHVLRHDKLLCNLMEERMVGTYKRQEKSVSQVARVTSWLAPDDHAGLYKNKFQKISKWHSTKIQ